MLEGKNVNLRVAEKEDAPLIAEWWNDMRYLGEHQGLMTISKTQTEKKILENPNFFIIEKKDGTKIGHVDGWIKGSGVIEIGFAIVPSERRKGYGTETVRLMVDYYFLTKDIVRIEARTGKDNLSSQKALEKAGFSNEGIMRKSLFARGKYIDMCLYSILREEWKGPKILTKTD